MNKAKENLLLHPVRMRIILAAAGRQVTAQQLANELRDIPQATLYRNINLLAASGMLNVVQERKVHNTVEKTYALPDKSLMLSGEDLKDAEPEDYFRPVVEYFGLLLSYYARYLQRGDVNLERDHVLFQMTPIYLSAGEARELRQAVRDLLLPHVKNGPSPERQRLILGMISFPDVVGAAAPTDSKAKMPTVKSTPPHKKTEKERRRK